MGACGVMTVGGGALVPDLDLNPPDEGLNWAIDVPGMAGGGHKN